MLTHLLFILIICVRKEIIKEVTIMTAINTLKTSEQVGSLRYFINALDESIAKLEKDLTEVKEMGRDCDDEWCLSVEHVLDELHNELFSISEPRSTTGEDSEKIKELKGRLHSLYNTMQQIPH